MTGFSRRDMVAAATGTETFGQGQPPLGPTPAPLAGTELPSFRFQLGAVAPKTWDGGWAKEATVVDFPVSQAIAGVLMSLVPGGLRDADRRLQCRRRLVFPARVRPLDPGYRLRGLPVRARLRQRIFLGIRHVQHQRLGRPYAARGAGEVFRRTGVDFANFPKREVYIAKGAVPPPLPANPAPGALDRGPLTHRYQLLAQRPDTYSGGTNRLVSQRQFPISTTVTGALMQIKPGALREPHWHPNADEWQYYISGRARMTVFGSHGRVRTEEFNAGDVGYVPQGYGHYIENIGNEDVELLLALNNGVYESISLADWIGANPHLLLATNFEVPENTFKDFQTRNRFLAI